MDMKRILQAMDGIATKPVEGGNDMKKFLQVVTEGSNPHKVTLPVQMAMQHYAEVKTAAPKPIKEVKKTAMSSLLQQYVLEAEQELLESKSARKEIINEQARRIADRIREKETLSELSKGTLVDYVRSNVEEKDTSKNRQNGLDRALTKLTKENLDPNEYDNEGQMARQDLMTAEEAAEELRSILHNHDNLPEWVQAKITKAVDYLDTVRDYMKTAE